MTDPWDADALWMKAKLFINLALDDGDTQTCANPTHLYAGTQLENMADAMERGRHVATRRQIDDAQPTLWGLATGRSSRSPVAGS